MKKVFLFIMLAVSAVFADSLEQILDKGVIRIGLTTDQPPFSSMKDGVPVGFEVDFANRIGSDLFKKNNTSGQVELVIIEDADQRIPYLEENKVDLLIASLTVTDDRAKLVDFSMPYFSVNIGVLTRKGDSVKGLSDLNGKTIIVETGTTAENFFKKKGYQTKVCQTSAEGYRMLKSGDGDAYANDNVIVLAFPILDIDVEVNIKNLGSADFLAGAVAKGNQELLKFVNNELIELSKEGYFKNSFDNQLNPFYKGTAEPKYFLLDDIYSIFG